MTRILLIDDNTTFRSLLRRHLEKTGYQVLEAKEGEEGLRHLRDGPPDVVLCDLFMPGKEGLETIRELRQCSRVPIIALTGDGPAYASSILGLAEKPGSNRTVLKPFAVEDLLEDLLE